MMRTQWKIAVVAAVAAGVAYLGTATADDETKLREIKGCMAFQNKVRGDINKQVKAKEPKWDEIAGQTKEWLKVAEDLGKNKPPMGTNESWKTQTDKYLTNVKAVHGAVEKKDADGTSKALATIGESCGGCHRNHKPAKK
jgi:cytochrome c556